jgi:hypothetical protein
MVKNVFSPMTRMLLAKGERSPILKRRILLTNRMKALFARLKAVVERKSSVSSVVKRGTHLQSALLLALSSAITARWKPTTLQLARN